MVEDQLIGRAQQRRLGRVPVDRGRAFLDRLDLVLLQSLAQADGLVLGKFVARLAEEADAQDDDLAVAGGEAVAARQHIVAPLQEAGQGLGRVRQGGEDVDRPAPVAHDGGQRLPLIVGEVVDGDRRDARLAQSHGVAPELARTHLAAPHPVDLTDAAPARHMRPANQRPHDRRLAWDPCRLGAGAVLASGAAPLSERRFANRPRFC
jgi:hypothetical protein